MRRLWKYFFIGIAGRAIMMVLQNRVDDIWYWVLFAVMLIIVIFFAQGDIRYWLSTREKVIKGREK